MKIGEYEMINSETKIMGVIGHPIVQSKSPIMHNAMLQKLGLNMIYAAFDVEPDRLEQAILGVKAFHMPGLNVTIPHKVEVMKYLDHLSEEAQAVGAVNTIVNQNGKLIGYNTDGEGYVRSLVEETGVQLKGKKVAILGAGGAARAISHAISQHEIGQMMIVNRDIEKANQLKKVIHHQVENEVMGYDQFSAFIKEVDIIVNTTSVGMYPDLSKSLIPKKWIKPHHLVSDIIYNPLETKLLKDARLQGAKTHHGIGMFVYQGVIAFEKWTGIVPDPEWMRKVVLDSL